MDLLYGKTTEYKRPPEGQKKDFKSGKQASGNLLFVYLRFAQMKNKPKYPHIFLL
jgi:hypothetical protein